MSSLLSHNKEQTGNRKPLADSSSASPTGATRSLRHERLSRLNTSGSSDAGQVDSYITRRENRLSAWKKLEEDKECDKYKKMYEEALTTNERLKSRLDVSKQELIMVESQLERLTQQKGGSAERGSNVLETEKKERQLLEKKVTDMEEELKVKKDLTMENQRLKDENCALIRVISKLSK